MSDKQEPAADLLVSVIGTGLGAATGLFLSPDPITSAVVTAATLSLGAAHIPQALAVLHKARINRGKELFRGMDAATGSTEKTEGLLQDFTEETAKIWYQTYKDMLNAVDEAAVAPLGHMAAEYMQTGKKSDEFFRAFGRTVSDLDAPGIKDLEFLFQSALDNGDWHPKEKGLVLIRTGMGGPRGSEVQFRESRDGNDGGDWFSPINVPSAYNLIPLMKRHGLMLMAFDRPGTTGRNYEMGYLSLPLVEQSLSHLKLAPLS